MRHAVQHDIAKSFFLIARKQAREHRVAVEAREAPPHQPRPRVGQRGGAAIADDGKIQPLRFGHALALTSRAIHSRMSWGLHTS